jgi:hypothetical protein
MKSAITNQNWTTARFKQGEMLAFISSGGDLSSTGNVVDVFYLVVSNLDYQEVSEQSFSTLNEALDAINNKFFHWELISLAQNTGSGCDSCAAH